MTVVAIHQPDFMPWMGFFVKAVRADVFVILDHTSNNIKDGSWFRRVQLLVSGNPQWISVPVERGHVGAIQPIREMRISASLTAQSLFQKYKRSFEQNYGRCPHYPQMGSLFWDYFSSHEPLLANRNMAFIRQVMSLLGVTTPVVFSSSLAPQGSSTPMLIDMVKRLGGDTYLCGDGAGGYQDDRLFEEHGLRLVRNCFSPPPYRQLRAAAFVPGLSIVDLLVNEGAEVARALLSEYKASL